MKFEAHANNALSPNTAAKLMLGPRVVTVEEVRAAKDGIDIND